MRIIFIRHGDKAYGNNDIKKNLYYEKTYQTPLYQYDAPLLKNENKWKNSLQFDLLALQCTNKAVLKTSVADLSEQNIEEKCTNLCLPEAVFCSPYLRTRETWNFLKQAFSFSEPFRTRFVSSEENKQELYLGSHCFVDCDIREYLGKHTATVGSFDPSTQKYFTEQGVDSTKLETEEELEERVFRFCDMLQANKENYKCVWVISHGFTIQKCIECLLPQTYFYPNQGEIFCVDI